MTLARSTAASTGGFVVSPRTLAFTNGAVSPLIVHVVWQGAETITSITYAGSALSLIGAKNATAGSGNSSTYGILSPATGLNDVVITFSANPGSGAAGFVVSTTGGDIATGWRTVFLRNDADGTGPTNTVTDSVNGDLVFDCCVVNAATITFDGGEDSTNSFTNNIVGSGFSGGIGTLTATGANTPVGTTDVAFYAQIAFALIPASAAGGNAPTFPLPLSSGRRW
jgi:hypothetical protein